MKICMIGCGSFARLSHGPAQQRYAAGHADVELGACCDVDENRVRDYSRTFGFSRTYADLYGMLAAEEPDAVVLAVPPESTGRAASLVLERGIPLLLEKPPGMTPAELGQLIRAAEKGGAKAQVGFNRRYMPVVRRAQEILDAAFAPTAAARIDYDMTRFDRWDRDFSTTAIHAIDTALFLARSPFRAAEIRYQAQGQDDRETVNVAIELECVSGTRVRISIQPVAGLNAESATLHSVGQSLAIRIPLFGQSRRSDRLEHWRGNELAASFADDDADVVERMGIYSEIAAFFDAVRSGAELTPRLQDCQQQVELMEAIRLRRTGQFEFSRTHAIGQH